MEDAAQIPACRLAQDVAIEKILAALAATRDGLGNPPATPLTRGPCQVPTADCSRWSSFESALEGDHHAGVRIGKGALAQVSHTVH